ncbi:hypothetical protein Pcinc_013307 [Petrolisthes cinctipes]|uniref:Uncharacterized protein n=1 Tax=Petrolisthes cinctipes TaxID=88211 RepID=A0AAE1FXN9_PETCI|nr:hypothetical protein Pcinc_013307 [Petrolisthes cinctipes]
MPPLHIKLGLMKQFVKALNQESAAFKYLLEFFPKLSETKIKVVKGFLGNHRAENYQQLVQDLVKAFGTMGCRMSLKLHMLDAHLDKFKDNMGAYSEEQGE